jgi:hypothetical protein
MKHIKLFEEFKKDYGTKMKISEFEKLAEGTEVLYRGAKFVIEENTGVTLVLKPVKGGNAISVNLSMFGEFGAIPESVEAEAEEAIDEARGINAIQNEWTKHTAKMKETVAEWKEASGKTKDSLLAKLKEMTKKKEEIEKEMYDAISLKDKDLELALESISEAIDVEYWEGYNDDTTAQAKKEWAEKSKNFEKTFKDGYVEWNTMAADDDNAEGMIKGGQLPPIKKLAQEFFKKTGWISINVVHAMIMQES